MSLYQKVRDLEAAYETLSKYLEKYEEDLPNVEKLQYVCMLLEEVLE